LFENNVDELPIILRDGITADIAFWLPYIIINDLTVERKSRYEADTIGQALQISLTVQVTSRGSEIPITLLVTPSTITIV
jgi:hypothetical protein